MKSLNKSDFLKLLKTISSSLEKEEIKYDIPFTHIDKIEFNHINIIIPDNITTFQLNKLFNFNKINEKSNIIYTIYQDFAINFIKSSPDDWNYNFYYYCWNILPNLINVMIKPHNLEYTLQGLKYKINNKGYFLTKNMKDIFELLELNFSLIINGFPTDYTIFNFVESLSYFDYNSFSIELFKENDIMFEYNKSYYEDFLKHIPELTSDKLSLDDQIEMLDVYFPKSRLLEKISFDQLKNELPKGVKLKNIKLPFIEKLSKQKEKDFKNKKIDLKKHFFKDGSAPKAINEEDYEIDL